MSEKAAVGDIVAYSYGALQPDLTAKTLTGYGEVVWVGEHGEVTVKIGLNEYRALARGQWQKEPQGRDCPVLTAFYEELEESRKQAHFEAQMARHNCPQCRRHDGRILIGSAADLTRYECGRCSIEWTVFDRAFYEDHDLPVPPDQVKPSSRPRQEKANEQ